MCWGGGGGGGSNCADFVLRVLGWVGGEEAEE